MGTVIILTSLSCPRPKRGKGGNGFEQGKGKRKLEPSHIVVRVEGENLSEALHERKGEGKKQWTDTGLLRTW